MIFPEVLLEVTRVASGLGVLFSESLLSQDVKHKIKKADVINKFFISIVFRKLSILTKKTLIWILTAINQYYNLNPS